MPMNLVARPTATRTTRLRPCWAPAVVVAARLLAVMAAECLLAAAEVAEALKKRLKRLRLRWNRLASALNSLRKRLRLSNSLKVVAAVAECRLVVAAECLRVPALLPVALPFRECSN